MHLKLLQCNEHITVFESKSQNIHYLYYVTLIKFSMQTWYGTTAIIYQSCERGWYNRVVVFIWRSSVYEQIRLGALGWLTLVRHSEKIIKIQNKQSKQKVKKIRHLILWLTCSTQTQKKIIVIKYLMNVWIRSEYLYTPCSNSITALEQYRSLALSF